MRTTLVTFIIFIGFRQKPQDFKLYGQWAVVTGSTDGIGKGFANELASKGLDICLISRNEGKLKNTAKEIERNYGVKTKYIVADFTNPNIYSHIKEHLIGLDVGILVNNVGIFIDKAEAFSRHSEEHIKNVINVNMLSTAMMTSIILQTMIVKKRGLIVNVGSAAAEVTAPYLTIYSGSKAFVALFGTGLAYELKKFNIQVNTLTPSFVSTNMFHKHARAKNLLSLISFTVPSVELYVKSAILTLSSGDVKTCGYFIHEVLLMTVRFISVDILNKLIQVWFAPRKQE
ncbi:inactive hydroxysteroid dehydrogenase-like protein 1 isoform X2 [Rhodnius prolixus]|uniref:inactive hydroxysteroid dehydrogenase-like protein 1 isoform X2 n=1 Tax=Rhodnius prolixus TaxID=13249 RepID=UPI003D18ACBE